MTAVSGGSFHEIEEGDLRFCFRRDVWRVIKWDGHAAYKRIERLDGTKAVDFLALHEKKGLYFIEVKDFRTRLRSKDKEPLADEVAKKVRDTVAGLVAAARRDDTLALELLPFARTLMDSERRVRTVLWMEPFRRSQSGKALAVGRSLGPRLRWLTPKVAVMNRRKHQLEDVTVESLARGASS